VLQVKEPAAAFPRALHYCCAQLRIGWRCRILIDLHPAIGDKPFAKIEARHVRVWLDDRAARPEAVNGLLKPSEHYSSLQLIAELQSVLDATNLGHMTFLVNSYGKPFTANGFGNAMRQWCDQAGLPRCSSHGLRKAGATIAAENGASDLQLMAIFGWTRAEMATLCTRRANRRKLSQDGMLLMVPRT
jgi:integrase